MQTTYELYCDVKEKDVKIEGLQSEKNQILNQTEEKNNCITSQNKKIEKLLNEKQDLEKQLINSNEKYNNINTENIQLKEQVNVLQKMLSKTLNFCNCVKNSRFGRLFFKKQIKELPAPNNDKGEKEI